MTASQERNRDDNRQDDRKATWTILDVLRWTTGRFQERALPSPRLDAELLAASALGLARIQLYAQSDRPLVTSELGALRELVRRRQAGEPVAYITGHKEFWGLDLAVDPRVLIPRPDTETLVEEALERVPPDAAPKVADVGTGSGAIALALAKERPNARVFATDVSPDALAVARGNAERLGLGITILEGTLADPLRPLGAWDLVVANLPYVPTAEIARLSPEVGREPRLALDGGADGLDLLRALLAQTPDLLAAGGEVLLEVGAGQAPAVSGLCVAAGLVEVRTRRDLGGVERVVCGRRPSPP